MKIEVEGEVILDTFTNKLVKGAKGQSIFDKGKAARSAVHTGWWNDHIAIHLAEKAGYNELAREWQECLLEFDRLQKELGWSNIPESFFDYKKEIHDKFYSLFNAVRGNKRVNLYETVKFKDNSRYKVMKIDSAIIVEDT